MKTYRLSPAGRRLVAILMLAAASVGAFAIWALPRTLGISYSQWSATFSAAASAGWTAGQLIPAGILLVMAVAALLLLWSLWEEWSTSYTVDDQGLTYRTVPGVVLHYPWAAIRDVWPGEGEEPVGLVQVSPDDLRQIRNPLLRWLHRQSFGAGRVPIYAGIAGRDELLAEINSRSGAAIAKGAADVGTNEPPPAVLAE